MTALRTRGAWLAIAVAAALVVAIGLAAAGAFSGCTTPATKTGRPSAAVTASAHGAVAYFTAKTLARSVHPRVADTWGEIRARKMVFDTFQQYGFFPRTQEFIASAPGGRVLSANIVAIKEGESADRLIVGAHYDSVPVGEGYSDNATGIGLLLETAARLKSQPTPYTLVFVAFGAEEKGTVGSRYYVRSMTGLERKATIGMIDLDAPAGGDFLSVASRFGGPTWLRDDALTAAKSLGIPLQTSSAAKGRPAGTAVAPSDDVPFDIGGIATAIFTATNWTAGGGDGMTATAAHGRLWHTPNDTVRFIERTYPGRVQRQLADMSRLLETLLTSKLEKRP
jgi:alkaline phosphatase isozyme conversion protein